MEEISINILVEAKQEYTKQLTNILVPYFYEGIESIYCDACELVKEVEDKSALKLFQSLLKKVPKWNQDMIEAETQRILDRTQCTWLPDLIAAVFVSNTKILTAVKAVSSKKKVNLKVPDLEHFVHKCYIECAREFYKNPFLLDKEGISSIERQRNLREALQMVNQCIIDAVRKMLPFQEILQQYLGESFGDNEEIAEKDYSQIPVKHNVVNEYLSDREEDEESQKGGYREEKDEDDDDVSEYDSRHDEEEKKEELPIKTLDENYIEEKIKEMEEKEIEKETEKPVIPIQIDTSEKIEENIPEQKVQEIKEKVEEEPEQKVEEIKEKVEDVPEEKEEEKETVLIKEEILPIEEPNEQYVSVEKLQEIEEKVEEPLEKSQLEEVHQKEEEYEKKDEEYEKENDIEEDEEEKFGYEEKSEEDKDEEVEEKEESGSVKNVILENVPKNFNLEGITRPKKKEKSYDGEKPRRRIIFKRKIKKPSHIGEHKEEKKRHLLFADAEDDEY